MKKTMKKASLLLLTLALACCAAFAAAAEEKGYWTMQTDTNGMPVMVYTYTDKIDFTVEDGAPLEGGEDVSAPTDAAQPIAESVDAPAHLSNGQNLSEQNLPGQAAASSSGSIGAMAVLGVLSLAALGFALYRAI